MVAKPMKFQLLNSALIALLSMAPMVCAQESTPEFDPLGEHNDLPKLIRVQVEFIEMPHTSLTKLMKAPRTSTNDSDLREACDKLIEKKEAIVLETAIINTRSGQNATAESISEMIYATEYEPSEIPHTQDVKAEDLDETNIDVPRLMTPPTPTSFDTKKVGMTLEVEPILGANDKIIDLRFSPTLVYFTGWESWGKWHMKEAESQMQMPTFYVLRVTTGTTLIAGQTQMIAALSPKDEKGNTDPTRKIMVFVRADVLTIGK